MFPPIAVADEIRRACPHLRLGCFSARVKIQPTPDALWQEVAPLLNSKAHLDTAGIHAIPALGAARQAYKALGQDPSRYRLSAEALHRRLMKEQGLYQINNTVDIINILSLETGFSIGGYDLSKLEPPLRLEKGRADMDYQALGRGKLNIAHLPVLCDRMGPFGNPSSDSVRTCVDSKTQQLGLVFFDFGGQAELEPALERTQALLETYAEAQEVSWQCIT